MKKRTKKQERPSGFPYLKAFLGDDLGTFTFKIPTPGRATQLAHREPKKKRGKREAGLAEDQVIIGALVAHCWADEVWELESDPNDGAAVYEELHGAGWRPAVAFGLHAAIWEQISLSTPTEEEVGGAATFFGPRLAADEPMNLNSVGNTAATSMPTPA